MDSSKLDLVINIIREEMMAANAAGSSGGFSGSANSKGPVAGFDPVMGMTKRKGPQIKLPPGSRKRWTPKKD